MLHSPIYFVYGSLMAPEVLEMLISRVPTSKRATLDGYKRFRLVGRQYPGAYPHPGSKIDGLILTGMNKKEEKIIDRFEGSEYTKQLIKYVITEEDVPPEEKEGEAWIYMYKYPENLIEGNEWSYEYFREHSLNSFIGNES